MNLVGAHVGGGLVADAPGVIGRAIGQAPGAIVAGGLGQQCFVMGNQALVSRIHHLIDGAGYLGAQFLAQGFRELLWRDLRQLFVKAGVQHVLARRGSDETPHLFQHFLHGELRWQDAQRFAMAQAFQHLIELGAKQAQPADVIAGVALALHEVAVGHEVRQATLRPEHLIDREIVVAEALAVLDQIAEEGVEDVVGNQCLTLVVSALVALEGGVIPLQLGQLGFTVRQRIIAEFGVVTLDAHRFQQPHLREHLRIVERELQEYAAIEPVDAERLAVPGMCRQRAAEQQRHSQQ